MTNGDCENCTKREAVTRCPCGCSRWICSRCVRAVRRVMLSHVKPSEPVEPPKVIALGPIGIGSDTG